jgi:hypothetical protein
LHAHGRVVAITSLVAALAPLLVACGSNPTGSSNASCVGPYLDDQPPSGRYGAPAPTATPGGRLTFYGHWYTTTCNDTGGSDPLQPMAPVHLTLTLPSGQAVPLGEFTPEGKDMGFAAEVRIPPGTGPGTATIRDDQKYPNIYRFEVTASK